MVTFGYCWHPARRRAEGNEDPDGRRHAHGTAPSRCHRGSRWRAFDETQAWPGTRDLRRADPSSARGPRATDPLDRCDLRLSGAGPSSQAGSSMSLTNIARGVVLRSVRLTLNGWVAANVTIIL